MIFIFRHYDSQKRIIIYAESYLEAKEALFEFNPYADKTYNILEYKKYEVDKHGLYFLSKSDIEFEIEEQLKGYNSELLKTPKVHTKYKAGGKK